MTTMSPVSCQPFRRRLQHAGLVGLQIAEHDVRALHPEPAAILHARHRLEPRLHAGHQPADRAETVEHRRVQRQHRRRLRHAVALQDAQPELFHVGAARRLLHRLGARQDVAERAEIVGVRRARIAGQERVGAEQDGGVAGVDQLRHDPVVQRRGVEIDAHARDERQDQARRQPEGMEHGQHVEHLVGAPEIDAGRRLRGVRQHVAVREHDALGRALRAGGEEDRRAIVGAPLHQRLLGRQAARAACRGSRRWCARPPGRRPSRAGRAAPPGRRACPSR